MSVLLAQLDGEVLVLTLNRPEKANAMNEAMHDEFVAQLAKAHEDDGIRAVVLAGAGERTFSAGADLKEFAELERSAAGRKRRVLLVRTLMAAVDFPKPLVAAVGAQALGAGCMLALLADEVIMADVAQLGMPEIKHGMPTPIGIVILAARGGMQVARQMVQRGEPVDAQRALACGLADEVTQAKKTRSRALERARALAQLPGVAFKPNKHFMNKSLRAALNDAAVEADRL
ncbi:MAG: enoyl-CoA hydratase/isomerase family protein [Betaproteobacteria bacterium]|nr:enoyl-CoA hydratase/isomerase family protein [Betaproteobacteria bacterium]